MRKLSQNPDTADLDSIRDECQERWSLLSDLLFDIFHNTTQDIETISWFIYSQLIFDNTLESVANSINWLSELVEREWSTLNPVFPKDELLNISELERVNQR